MARKLSEAIEGMELVAEYFYLDLSRHCEWVEAARIEIVMNEKVMKLLSKY